jgi:hypothetical protein
VEIKGMILQGHIRNGVVILDEPPKLPEGTPVRVEAVETAKEDDQGGTRRQGGQYAGQIRMAPDFDQWPTDLQEALGMTP